MKPGARIVSAGSAMVPGGAVLPNRTLSIRPAATVTTAGPRSAAPSNNCGAAIVRVAAGGDGSMILISFALGRTCLALIRRRRTKEDCGADAFRRPGRVYIYGPGTRLSALEDDGDERRNLPW